MASVLLSLERYPKYLIRLKPRGSVWRRNLRTNVSVGSVINLFFPFLVRCLALKETVCGVTFRILWFEMATRCV